MHLRTVGLQRRCLAGTHAALRRDHATLRQRHRLLCQALALLGPQGAVENRDHLATQLVAPGFQAQCRHLLAALGQRHSRTALAAQLQRLADTEGGGAIARLGAFLLPGERRVAQQAGLLAQSLGDADFPGTGGQFGVAAGGGLQGILDADLAGLHPGRELPQQQRQQRCPGGESRTS